MAQSHSSDLWKIKLIATGIHLLASLVIFVVLAYLIHQVWYPQPYYSIDGGWQGIRLVAAVDLVLGPLLTLLIFNPGKSQRAIFFDLVVILTIQFGALSYGVSTTYAQRPVAIVMVEDSMTPAIMSDYLGTLEAESDLSQFSRETPPIILSSLSGFEGLAQARAVKQETGIHAHAQVQWYQSADEFRSVLESRQNRFTGMLSVSEVEARLMEWLHEANLTRDDIMLGRFNGRYGVAWLLFDRDARYLGYFIQGEL